MFKIFINLFLMLLREMLSNIIIMCSKINHIKRSIRNLSSFLSNLNNSLLLQKSIILNMDFIKKQSKSSLLYKVILNSIKLRTDSQYLIINPSY